MTDPQQVSPVTEEYLEQIYRLEKEHGVARTTQIAERVGVSLGTVTNTIEALKQRHLVLHEPYKGVKLTETGRKIALTVLRRHRLSERLLTDFLNIEFSKVHDHACRLEHVLTNDLAKSLEKALGHPKTCPHGNPIPTMCGGIVEEESYPLGNLDKGAVSVVVKIVDERSDLLEYLARMNLVPGTRIHVVDKAPLNGPITVTINGTNHPISRKIASLVWVRKEA